LFSCSSSVYTTDKANQILMAYKFKYLVLRFIYENGVFLKTIKT